MKKSMSRNELVCGANKTAVKAEDFLADDVREYAPDGTLISALCRLAKEEAVLAIEEEQIFE